MIFCVEDDSSIRDLMIYTLNTAGFEAQGFSEGESLMEALKERTPELIMLDIMLPGDDGITLLKKLKSQNTTAAIPVIMASAKGAEYDKVIGLDLGADDYLAKPFGMMEMISRVKAVLRRTSPKETPQVMRVGNLELSLSEHTVEAEGKRVELTFKEFELLKLLMKNRGFVISRDVIMERVWDTNYEGESRTIDVHVRSIRQKLGEAGAMIKTIRNVGYMADA